MTLRGALFDMDGLILDTERLGMEVFVSILTGQGHEAQTADQVYRSCVGKSLAKCRAAILKAFPGVDLDALDRDWAARLDQVFLAGMRLRPTARAALEHVAGQGIPMAIVTTTVTKRARHHLEAAGLLDLFRDVVGFDQVTCPKPAPEPYQTGAMRLGLAPAQCAAFEDSDTGVTAATCAGCVTWQVPDLRPAHTPLPELGQTTAPSLLEAVRRAFPIP